MLFSEITSAYCESHMKHTLTAWTKLKSFVMSEQVVLISTTWFQSGYVHTLHGTFYPCL